MNRIYFKKSYNKVMVRFIVGFSVWWLWISMSNF